MQLSHEAAVTVNFDTRPWPALDQEKMRLADDFSLTLAL